MAKKTVTVDEEALKGMMLGDMPVLGRRQPELPHTVAPSVNSEMQKSQSDEMRQAGVRQRTSVRPGKKTAAEPNDYRSRYLVPMPSSLRSQTYINKEVYDRIKRFLPVIAPEVSISGYISNILAEHLERYAKEINELYEKQFEKPL